MLTLAQPFVLAFIVASAANSPEAASPAGKLLWIHGLHATSWGLDSALASLQQHGLAVVPCQQRVQGDQRSLVGFPEAGLAGFEVVILSNVDAVTLGDDRLQQLAQFVRQGGGLLVLGGPASYGRGGYVESPLADVLPVLLTGNRDLENYPGGRQVSRAGRLGLPFYHRLLAGVDWPRRPPVTFWQHHVIAARHTRVVLKARSEPLLVVGEQTKGRVACVTAANLGAPVAGQQVLWTTTAWKQVMTNTLLWLAGLPQ